MRSDDEAPVADWMRRVVFAGWCGCLVLTAGCLDPSPEPLACEPGGDDCFKDQTCVDGTCKPAPGSAPGDTGRDTSDGRDTRPVDVEETRETSDTVEADGTEPRDTRDANDTDAPDTRDTRDGGTGDPPFGDAQPTIWLRAADLRDHDSLGDGDPVDRWTNRIDNEFEFIGDAFEGNPPTFVGSVPAIGGRPAVNFDGDETLHLEDRVSTFVETRTATIFFVVRNENWERSGELLASCDCNWNPRKPNEECVNEIRFDHEPGNNNNPVYQFFFRASGGSPSLRGQFPVESTETTDWRVLTFVLDVTVGADGTVELTVRDRRQLAMAHQRSYGGPDDTLSGSWQFNQIGAQCENHFLKGEIAEIIFFSSALDSSRFGTIEKWLAERYLSDGQ